MKTIIAVLMSISIAVVSSMTIDVEDYRFTKEDGRKFVGTFGDGKHLIFVIYHHSNDYASTNQTIADLQRSCGPYEKNFDILKQDNSYSVEILPLSGDKILVKPLILSENAFNIFINNIEIVDLSSCEVSHVSGPSKTKIPALNEKVIVRADSFDIYFQDSASCEKNVIKQSYDFEGKNISNPILTYGPFSVVPRVYPIGSQSRTSGEIAIGEIHGKNIAFLVNDRFKMLQQFTKSNTPHIFPAVTTSNNLITFADQLNSKTINVTQFDLEGNLKFKTVLNYEYNVRTAYLLNALNSYMYIIVSECDVHECTENENHYVVKKIDTNGKEIGSLVMELPSTNNITAFTVYEAEGSYCMSRLQETSEEIFTKVDIITKCFNDADFF